MGWKKKVGALSVSVPCAVASCGGETIDVGRRLDCAENVESFFASRGWSSDALPRARSYADEPVTDWICRRSGYGRCVTGIGSIGGNAICTGYTFVEIGGCSGTPVVLLYRAGENEVVAVLDEHGRCVAGPATFYVGSCTAQGVGFFCPR